MSRPLTVVAILLSMFLSAMEATVVSTAMPTVIAELHGIELYGWVGAIYMLATTVTIPLWGKLADVAGRRPAMLAGITLFLLGSMASGLSRSMATLVVMRAVQGLGAGSLQTVSLTIIGDLFTVQERGKIQGVFGAVWGVAGMAGPLVGGLIVTHLSWRWVFFVNLPFGLLSAAMLVLFYREAGTRERGALGRVDWAGAALLSAAVVSLLLGVGGRAWQVTLPLSLALGAAFVAVERRAADALLPLPLLARPIIRASAVLGALMGAVMMGALMYVPLYVQAVMHGSPTAAGSSIASMLVGWPLASAVSGRILARTGYRPLVLAGTVTIALSSAALAVALGAGTAALAAIAFALGVGMGLANTALLIAVQESVAHAERGVATATAMFARTIGGAIAVGALGALLGALLAGHVPPGVLDELLAHGHGGGVSGARLAEVEVAIAAAMRPMFFVVATLGAACLAAGLAFPRGKAGARDDASDPAATGAADEPRDAVDHRG